MIYLFFRYSHISFAIGQGMDSKCSFVNNRWSYNVRFKARCLSDGAPAEGLSVKSTLQYGDSRIHMTPSV